MRTKFSGILTLLLAFVVQLMFAQQRTISGTITDDTGTPLFGVNIAVKGTTAGTQTDFDGNYSIQANDGQVLEFSYIGFETVERTVTASTSTISFAMQTGSDVLDEVVIRGYSTISSKRSVIASQQINAENIESRPNVNALQTLQGQVAGLIIASPSGQPGSAPNVMLRGFTSINGQTEPLYIIDGMPSTATVFASINPQDIENVSVLKDAAATSIYGNRGANGVIVVTTKVGSYESDLEIEYSGWTNFSTLQRYQYDLLDSQQQLRLEQEYGAGLGITLTDEEIDAMPTFDWLDYFFRTGISQNHNLRLSSGGTNTNQATSIGFSDTQGILQNSGIQRFNFRNNTSMKTNNERLRVSTNLSLNFTKQNIPGSIGTGGVNQNFILGALQGASYVTPDDYYSQEDPAGFLLDNLIFRYTPLMLIDKLNTYDRVDNELRGLGGIRAEYDLHKNLTLSSNTQMEYRTINRSIHQDPLAFNSRLFAPGGDAANPTPGWMDLQHTTWFTVNQITSLRWQKEFDKHYIGLGAYTEYFKAHLRMFGFRQEGLDPSTWRPGDGGGFIADNADNDWYVDIPRAQYRDAGLFSYFGQMDYSYDSRYGLSASIRRDASFRFAGSNRWGTFWSVGANWNISEEDFMADSNNVNTLKLRGSYGTQGNQNVTNSNYWGGAMQFANTWGSGGGYQGQNAVLLNSLGYDALRWEILRSYNVGLDFGFFDNRLRGSVDYYKKITDDMFIPGPTSLTVGISTLDQNLGSMENTGYELQFAYDIFRKVNEEDFNLRFNFAGSYNKNEITDWGPDTDEVIGWGRVGGPVFEYYTIPYAGVNPENGNLLFLDAEGNETETPGDDDRRWTGKNFLPDYQGSFGFDIDYKNFFLQTQFNYVFGVYRFESDYSILMNPASIGEFRHSTDILNHWTPDNTDTNVPSLTAGNLGVASDRFLQNADFVRLRFVSLGYNFSKKQLERTGLKKLRLFANGENLLTFTKWEGFDPEQMFIPGTDTNADVGTGRRYPTPRTYSIGLEIGF